MAQEESFERLGHFQRSKLSFAIMGTYRVSTLRFIVVFRTGRQLNFSLQPHAGKHTVRGIGTPRRSSSYLNLHAYEANKLLQVRYRCLFVAVMRFLAEEARLRFTRLESHPPKVALMISSGVIASRGLVHVCLRSVLPATS